MVDKPRQKVWKSLSANRQFGEGQTTPLHPVVGKPRQKVWKNNSANRQFEEGQTTPLKPKVDELEKSGEEADEHSKTAMIRGKRSNKTG